MKQRALILISFSAAILCALLMLEAGVRMIFFRKDSFYQKAYNNLLAGKPKFLAKACLNYVNNPDYTNAQGRHVINTAGLKRFSEVNLNKEPGVFRILFLGGSTTFGEVENPDITYPALIERSLNKQLMDAGCNYSRVECLNAGLPSGTSAEILTHYALKLNYLHPDLMVINSGINDAVTYLFANKANYQPDYGNCRQSFQDFIPLSETDRLLFKSKAMAFILIRLKYYKYITGGIEYNLFINPKDEKNWFTYRSDSLFSPNYNAFYNNIKSTVALAGLKKQKVLLVTEVINPVKQASSLSNDKMLIIKNGIQKHEEFLQLIAKELSVPICLLPKAEFTESKFLPNDVIHLNEEGEALKARYIQTAIEQIMKQ